MSAAHSALRFTRSVAKWACGPRRPGFADYACACIRRASSGNSFESPSRTEHPGVGATDTLRDGQQDPVEKLFLNRTVQQALKRLAGQDLSRIYGRKPQRKLSRSEIRLLTDAELNQMRQKKIEEVSYHMQMPPVMSPRQPCERVIAEEPLLDNYDSTPNVFVDITYGIKPRERYIAVRETNGTLRTATWEERDRMNQVYFEVEGRQIEVPALFADKQVLQQALNQGFAIYILDRACVQFEPDDPKYIQVRDYIHDYLDQSRSYDLLGSTRHMGGFIFHLVLSQQIDNFLIHLLQAGRKALLPNGEESDCCHQTTERTEFDVLLADHLILSLLDACLDVLRVFYIVHPDFKRNVPPIDDSHPVDALKAYVKASSQTKGNLELAIQAYQEQVRQQEEAVPSADQVLAHS